MDNITKQFIREHLNDDVPTLALKKAPVGTDFSLALRQIEARQLLQKKVPEWSQNEDLLFSPRLSIEQCSSEVTARYKAALIDGSAFADLTGGLGIDTYYINQAHNFSQAHYVEPQAALCDLARHNFATLKADIKVWNETADAFLNHCPALDGLYLDPSRRDVHGHKTVSIADCTPNVVAMQDTLLQTASQVMVKLSPMLDISRALDELHHVKAVHVVAVNNECKELVFIIERGFSGHPTVHCANLLTAQPTLSFTFDQEHNSPLRLAEVPMRYLYEPNAALMKAGGYKWVAAHYGLLKLHRNSHLYTSDTLLPDFAGRVFEVEDWAVFNHKVKNVLLADVSRANVAVRNFPLSVEELRKTLKINDGGEYYLFATTLRDERKILIKTKKSASM